MFNPIEANELDENKIIKVHFVGVGWDCKIKIWPNDKKEMIEAVKCLPEN